MCLIKFTSQTLLRSEITGLSTTHSFLSSKKLSNLKWQCPFFLSFLPFHSFPLSKTQGMAMPSTPQQNLKESSKHKKCHSHFLPFFHPSFFPSYNKTQTIGRSDRNGQFHNGYESQFLPHMDKKKTKKTKNILW